MPRKIPSELQQQIRQRAGFLCEYCHISERWQYVPFTIDHLVPVPDGGDEAIDNLALACFHCNRRKSDKRTAPDPQTGQMIPIFNPRLHRWAEHFIWSMDKLHIIPLTAIGRATAQLLELNRERAVNIRAADVVISRHPPADDPVQQANEP